MRKLFLMIGLLLVMGAPGNAWPPPKYLHTTFLKSGEHLECASSLRIRLSGFISRRINYLGDFQGAVDINTPQKALDFVRLMTSCTTYYLDLWPQKAVVEIMDRNQAKRMPNYGLPGFDLPEQSGIMGILSEAVMKKSGLSLAKVRPDHDGYVITRWLLRYDNELLYVEEKVSRDGQYHRRKLKERSAPDLPGTLLMIPPGE